MPNDPLISQTFLPVRPRLERLYESMHGCWPDAQADLRPQACYLPFILPEPDVPEEPGVCP